VTTFVLRYREYLRDVDISDFVDDDAAKNFASLSSKLGGDYAEAKDTVMVVYGPASFRHWSHVLRRDLFNLLVPTEEECRDFETIISAPQLFEAMERFMS